MSLLKYCKTDREREIVRLNEAGEGNRSVAHTIRVNESTVYRTLRRVKQRAEVQGFSPENDLVHAEEDLSYLVKGTSTLYDKEGNVKLQWVKTNLKNEAMVKVAEAVHEALREDIEGLAKPRKEPSFVSNDIMNVIPIGDAHFGVKIDANEASEDYDLEKNVKRHKEAISYLLSKASYAKVGVLINVGDFIHIHDHTNKTPRSGNIQDVDGRWHNIVKEATYAFVDMINMMLEKHQEVKVISSMGNHDPSSYMMNLILDAYYRNEKRLTIDTSPSKFHYHQFGKNMLMVTHSDTIKPTDAPSIMATDQPKMWGDTVFRFAHLGHQHHKDIKEHRGCVVEIHRTLTPGDAWHTASGYRSQQECKLITYHKDFGEIERIMVNPYMLPT